MMKDVLIDLAARDHRITEEVRGEPAFRDGYHPTLERLHREHAHVLAQIIDAHGWPHAGLVGEEAAAAAWLVAQHAIGQPAFQRRCRALLDAAVAAGQAPAWQAAYLGDRICFHEGRPQRFGLVVDWNDAGALDVIGGIDDAPHVDERRAALGLAPLAEHIARLRAEAAARGEQPPADLAAKRARARAWAERVGWIAPPLAHLDADDAARMVDVGKDQYATRASS
jgi:hypothetical protein